MKIIKNPDTKKYEEVTAAVKANDNYCPCAVIKTLETKCPCKEFLDSQQLGECCCGRYIKTEI